MSVVIQKYNPIFVRRFAAEKKKLKNLLGGDYSIQHVGSTSIPGLDGKNIIDILVSANLVQDMAYIKEILVSNGYFASKQSKDDKSYIFFASRKEETGEGDIHIHLALKGTQCHNDFLILRDYLRFRPDEVTRYLATKHSCAKRANNDRKKYKQYKSEYVNKLMDRARVWHEN